MIRYVVRAEILVIGPWMPLRPGPLPGAADGDHPGARLLERARLQGWTSRSRLEAAHAAREEGTPLAGDCEAGWEAGGHAGHDGSSAPDVGPDLWSDLGL